MKSFEYLIGGLDVKWDSESEQTQLDKFGAVGWELVSVLLRSNSEGKPCVFYYFRREILPGGDNQE